jgi:hypothetical protein
METYSNNKEDIDNIIYSSISSTETDNIFEKNIEDLPLNNIIINNKNDGSSVDSNKKKQLDDINFNYNNNEILKSSFYNLEQLNKLNFKEIYNILNISQMLIFVDNKKLIKLNKINIFECFKKQKNIYEDDFMGCTFMAWEYIYQLKKDLHILNNNVLEGEFKNYKIYNNDDLCYCICFDEGQIHKNVLYKKMEIINKIIYVPFDKFHIKETEYKIRGFCQIVEELGAKKIEIIFQKNDNSIVKKSLNAKINTNIELIAGNLGLASCKTEDESQDYKYTLKYPSNNTIVLDEKLIRNKIKNKKLIISENIYNSNLELQYVIRSRCRHFITNYSTVFTMDISNNIEKHLDTQFKTYGINIGLSGDSIKIKKNYIQIITNVIFSDDKDYNNNVMGYSVSPDKIGFNFLISTLNKDDFKINGIYKIMDFINVFIDKYAKHTTKYNYINILTILNKINIEFTLKEYAELLCNYFDINSQWIHLENYINILENKTYSYDKLGYLILININISDNIKFNNIIKFIQEYCVKENIEDKFWKMLQLYKKEYYYLLKYKLFNEYTFIKSFNWYNLMSFINNIKDYEINLVINSDDYIKNLIKNMKLGFSYNEYYFNILPYMIRLSHNIIKDNREYCSTILERTLFYESFILSNIQTLNDLKKFIENKVYLIILGKELYDELKPDIYINLVKNIDDINFINKYGYFIKKLKIIIDNYDRNKSLVKYIVDDKINFIDKLLKYNDKLNINNIPLNNLGFILMYEKFINGLYEYDKIVEPFINRYYKFLIDNLYDNKTSQYKILSNLSILKYFNISMFMNNMTFYDFLLKFKEIIDNIKNCKFNDILFNDLLS